MRPTEKNNPGANYRGLFSYSGEQNKERIFFAKDGASDVWFRCLGTTLSGQGVAAPIKNVIRYI